MILKDTREARAGAATTIRRGGIIAFRTDTFYGLGADPFNAAAVRRIRELKGRTDAKPILLLISDPGEVARFLIEQTEIFKSVAGHFWPGAITLIGLARPGLPVELTAGTNTIGLRLPNDQDLRSLLRACGGALTATSANPSGSAPASTTTDVLTYFPTGLDLILDAGAAISTKPSTVLDLSGVAPRLIREGVVKREELEKLSADLAQ